MPPAETRVKKQRVLAIELSLQRCDVSRMQPIELSTCTHQVPLCSSAVRRR